MVSCFHCGGADSDQQQCFVRKVTSPSVASAPTSNSCAAAAETHHSSSVSIFGPCCPRRLQHRCESSTNSPPVPTKQPASSETNNKRKRSVWLPSRPKIQFTSINRQSPCLHQNHDDSERCRDALNFSSFCSSPKSETAQLCLHEKSFVHISKSSSHQQQQPPPLAESISPELLSRSFCDAYHEYTSDSYFLEEESVALRPVFCHLSSQLMASCCQVSPCPSPPILSVYNEVPSSSRTSSSKKNSNKTHDDGNICWWCNSLEIVVRNGGSSSSHCELCHHLQYRYLLGDHYPMTSAIATGPCDSHDQKRYRYRVMPNWAPIIADAAETETDETPGADQFDSVVSFVACGAENCPLSSHFPGNCSHNDTMVSIRENNGNSDKKTTTTSFETQHRHHHVNTSSRRINTKKFSHQPSPILRLLSLILFQLPVFLLVFFLCSICADAAPTTYTQQLYSVGSNSNGQLGQGDTVDHTTDAFINPPSPVINVTSSFIRDGNVTCFDRIGHISTGLLHSIYDTQNNGLMYGFGGQDGTGALGDGTGLDQLVPVLSGAAAGSVVKGKFMVQADAGSMHTMYLDSSGQVYVSGFGFFNTNGDGTTNSYYSPMPVDTSGALNGVVVKQISAGGEHNAVLGSNGQVYAWGNNPFGQCGDGSSTNQPLPVAMDLSALSGRVVTGIAAGYAFTLLFTDTKEVFCTGGNDVGQCADTTVTSHLSPSPIYSSGAMNGKVINQISAGAYHSAFLTADGLVFTSGENTSGELGDGSTFNRNEPTLMDFSALAGRTAQFVAANYGYTLIVTSDGLLFGAGGKFVNSLVPIQLNTAGIGNVTRVSGGFGDHALILGSCPDLSDTVCNSHGAYTCDGKCHCCEGYSGPNCAETQCNGVSSLLSGSVCSGNGTCVSYNNCSCSTGYSGSDCQLLNVCFGQIHNETSVCSGHGSCTGVDECSCSPGWTGPQCNILDNCNTHDQVFAMRTLDWSTAIDIASRNVSTEYVLCSVVSHEWNLTALTPLLYNQSLNGVSVSASPQASTDPGHVHSSSIHINAHMFPPKDATYNIYAKITLSNGAVVTEVFPIRIKMSLLVSSFNTANHIRVYSSSSVQISAASSYDPSHCDSSPFWNDDNTLNSVAYKWKCHDYFSGESCFAPYTSVPTWTLSPVFYGMDSGSSSPVVKIFSVDYIMKCLGEMRSTRSYLIVEMTPASDSDSGDSDSDGEKTYEELLSELKGLLDTFTPLDLLPGLQDSDYAHSMDLLWEFAQSLLHSNTSTSENQKLIEEMIDTITENILDVMDEDRAESPCLQDKEHLTLNLMAKVSSLFELLNIEALELLNQYLWNLRGICTQKELGMMMNITEHVLKTSQLETVQLTDVERLQFDATIMEKNIYALCASARDIKTDDQYYAAQFFESKHMLLKLEKKRLDNDWNMDTCTATLASALIGKKSSYYSSSVATSKPGGGMNVLHVIRAERWRTGSSGSGSSKKRKVTGKGLSRRQNVHNPVHQPQNRKARFSFSFVATRKASDDIVSISQETGMLGDGHFSDPTCLFAMANSDKHKMEWDDATQCTYERRSKECHCYIAARMDTERDLYGMQTIAIGVSRGGLLDESSWTVVLFTVTLAVSICLLTLSIMCFVSIVLRFASTSARMMENVRKKQRERRQVHDLSMHRQASEGKSIGYIDSKKKAKLQKIYGINHGVMRQDVTCDPLDGLYACSDNESDTSSKRFRRDSYTLPGHIMGKQASFHSEDGGSKEPVECETTSMSKFAVSEPDSEEEDYCSVATPV